MGNRFFIWALLFTSLLSTVPAFAGVVGGAKKAHYVLLPRQTDAYHFTLKGGEQTTITVTGQNVADLNCRLLDSTGKVVDQDLDPNYSGCILTVTPKRDEKFTLTIFGDPRNRVKAEIYDVETN